MCDRQQFQIIEFNQLGNVTIAKLQIEHKIADSLQLSLHDDENSQNKLYFSIFDLVNFIALCTLRHTRQLTCFIVHFSLFFFYFFFFFCVAAKWAKFRALDIRTWLLLKSAVNIWRIHFWDGQFTETFHHSTQQSPCVRSFVQ